MDLVRSVSLSAKTTVRRIEDIRRDIESQFKENAKHFKWYSLTLDESTDSTDTVQLLMFIRGVNNDFEVTEELAAMNSLHGSHIANNAQKFSKQKWSRRNSTSLG